MADAYVAVSGPPDPHHVVAFVNNEPVRDKQSLSEPVPPDGEIYVFQALSGG